MKYEIRVEKNSGLLISAKTVNGPKVAAKFARQMASDYPDGYVFVQWFRSSDHQTGYLNPGENHAPTGKRW